MSRPDSVTVSELLTRVASGDRGAFRDLYAKAGPKLFAVCLRLLRSRDVAEDVLQEAFIRIWERSWQYDRAKGDGLAWLATLTRHCALDRLRRQPVAHVEFDETVTGEIDRVTAFDPHHLAEGGDLMRCLGRLRDEYRDVVVMAYVNGHTHEELAEHFGRPLGTIKSWVKRGLEQLKECLEP